MLLVRVQTLQSAVLRYSLRFNICNSFKRVLRSFFFWWYHTDNYVIYVRISLHINDFFCSGQRKLTNVFNFGYSQFRYITWLWILMYMCCEIDLYISLELYFTTSNVIQMKPSLNIWYLPVNLWFSSLIIICK